MVDSGTGCKVEERSAGNSTLFTEVEADLTLPVLLVSLPYTATPLLLMTGFSQGRISGLAVAKSMTVSLEPALSLLEFSSSSMFSSLVESGQFLWISNCLLDVELSYLDLFNVLD